MVGGPCMVGGEGRGGVRALDPLPPPPKQNTKFPAARVLMLLQQPTRHHLLSLFYLYLLFNHDRDHDHHRCDAHLHLGAERGRAGSPSKGPAQCGYPKQRGRSIRQA
jgi:hypothetical protein